MKYILLTFFSISLNLKAQVSIQSLKFNEKRAPYILQVLSDQIKKSNFSPLQELNLLKKLKALNENQKGISQKVFIELVYVEAVRSILNLELSGGFESDKVSQNDIEKLQTKVKENQVLYTSLAQMILNLSISDFQPYIKKGNLNNLQTTTPSNSKLQQEKMILKNIIEYSGKWINKGLSLSALEFNALASKTVTPILDNLIIKTKLFKLYSSPDKETLETELYPQIQLLINDYKQKALKAEKSGAIESPKNTVKSIQLDIPADPKKEIDNLLQDIDQQPSQN